MTPLEALPPCAQHVLNEPNDWLLKPSGIQLVTRCLLALGWRPLIDEYIDGGALVIVGPQARSSRGYYVTWPAGRPSPAVESLVDWLATDPP